MARRYIAELVDQESVDEIFLANNKQLRSNRNGDLYLSVELSDRTGSLQALMWNVDESVGRKFENGEFIRVRGTTQIYQGALQMIATSVARAPEQDVDPADFYPLAPRDLDQLSVKLAQTLRSLRDPHLRSLAECFLADEEFMRKFCRAPAGIKHHHAYHGGLLEHVCTMLDLARCVAQVYPAIDADLLVMGVFLHDVGKIDELSYDRTFAYSDEGQLIGHVVMAISMLDEKLRQAEQLSGEAVPKETVMRLKHMIVSHHGQYEFGSPKLPMTLEAVALTYIDNLDSKLQSFHKLMCDDPGVEGSFTVYHPQLQRKLYKGRS